VTDEPAAGSTRAAPQRRTRDLVRHLAGLAIGIVVLLLLFGRRGDLQAARHDIAHASAGWLAAAVAAEAASLCMFSFLQHRVLRLGGASVPLTRLVILSLANDAIANSVPGEPAVSGAYRYRYYRRHGVTGAAAGWTIFTVLIAQSIGMSLLLLAGIAVAAGSVLGDGTGATGPSGAGDARAAGLGLVIVAAAVAVLIRRDLLLRLVSAAVRGTRRLTGHPRGIIGERIEATLARMREIPLGARSTVTVVAVAACVWLCDFGCLVCAFGAVHAAVPWAGVLLAYGAAQVAGSLPVVPGGLGIVEGSLAVILTAYGAGRVPAVSAALVYRLISFWLAIATGWISVGVIARRARRVSP
jgi:uncharacterized protein (TIRG00374 family)